MLYMLGFSQYLPVPYPKSVLYKKQGPSHNWGDVECYWI